MSDNTTRRTMMVDTQVRPSDVTKFPIIDAMLAVPREAYVPRQLRDTAYIGENLPLAENRVILEPRTLAKMLDALDIANDELVLDIGCGLGYSTAVIARMAQAVIGLESDESMAEDAQATLSDHDVDNAMVQVGALKDGAAEHGPYDVIILQGAVEILPETLSDQLKENGRICALFAQGALGVVRVGYKVDGQISWRDEFNAGAPVLEGFQRASAFEF
ncbi:protein-L-isoaspartate O-methyltransferase [Cognatishimia sp. MH4019]|uniref:protein-L-isoaspartate O-methyltransferase family protein n=1 Tax=Cognatishimia sp. MH4019 TaxID=2854030 RepID=UPI001CD634D4|nr:protein-L-isoaspartate O-methyltransferase [Cognatishimia sp. MH4019]